MQEYFWLIISFLLIIIGILGTVLPVLPGLILSFAGLLAYKFGVDSSFNSIYLWIFGFFTLLSMTLDYIVPAKLNKKYGGTKWGSIGAVLGMLIGLFFIPTPFGFLIGMAMGVLTGELLHDKKDYQKAINSTKGALIGFLMSTSFNLIIGFTMLITVLAHWIM